MLEGGEFMLLTEKLALTSKEEFSIIGPLFAGLPVSFSVARSTNVISDYLEKCFIGKERKQPSKAAQFIVMECYADSKGFRTQSMALSKSQFFGENVYTHNGTVDHTRMSLYKHAVISFAGMEILIPLKGYGLGLLWYSALPELGSDEKEFKDIAVDCFYHLTSKEAVADMLRLAEVLDTNPGLSNFRNRYLGVTAPVSAYFSVLGIPLVYKRLNEKYSAGYTKDDLRAALGCLHCYTDVSSDILSLKRFVPTRIVKSDSVPNNVEANDTLEFVDIIDILEGGEV